MNRITFTIIALIILLVLVVVSLMLFSRNEGTEDDVLGTQIQPEWYGLQDDNEYFFTYGQSVRASAELAEKSAYTNAMAEAASLVNSQVRIIVSEIKDEAAIDDEELIERVVITTSEATLSGVSISQRRTVSLPDGRHQSFVKVQIPKTEVANSVVNNIKEDETLYRRLMESETFRNLTQ